MLSMCPASTSITSCVDLYSPLPSPYPSLGLQALGTKSTPQSVATSVKDEAFLTVPLHAQAPLRLSGTTEADRPRDSAELDGLSRLMVKWELRNGDDDISLGRSW